MKTLPPVRKPDFGAMLSRWAAAALLAAPVLLAIAVLAWPTEPVAPQPPGANRLSALATASPSAFQAPLASTVEVEPAPHPTTEPESEEQPPTF